MHLCEHVLVIKEYIESISYCMEKTNTCMRKNIMNRSDIPTLFL